MRCNQAPKNGKHCFGRINKDTMPRPRSILILLLVTISGCSAFRDVTYDPKYRPGDIIGKSFVLREGGYLCKIPPGGAPFASLEAPDGVNYPKLKDYSGGKLVHAQYRGEGEIDEVLPPGTIICVSSLTRWETFANRSVFAVADIGGRPPPITRALVSPLFIVPTFDNRPWRLDNKYLTAVAHSRLPDLHPAD